MNGLRLRDSDSNGNYSKTTDATLNDVWDRLPKSFKIHRSISIKHDEINVETFDAGTYYFFQI